MKKYKNKPKECIGCHSYISTINCELLSPSEEKYFFHIFMNMFCPCKECIVKPTCSEKIRPLRLVYYSHKKRYACPKIEPAINSFTSYLDGNMIRKTVIKRKKK